MIDNKFDEKWEDYSDFNQWERQELKCSQDDYAEYMYTRKKSPEKENNNSDKDKHINDLADKHEPGRLYKLAEKVINLIYPPSLYCVACDSFIDSSRKYNLCDNCIGKMMWIQDKVCHVCGRPLEEEGVGICYDCAENDKSFDGGFSCTAYGLYERKIIADFKKSGKAYLARTLGEILYDRIVIEDLKINGIIPIPVHKERLRTRGFNQTELMGRYLSRKTGWPMITDAVIRVKKTRAMKQLDRWDRAQNMKGAFQVIKPDKIKNKSLVVLDDIYTTGATMEECCKVLKAHGAQKVYILTFAAGIYGK